jgi:uncharacterized membrane protein
MNFHIFVAIITFVFYIFLRIYKSSVQNKKNKTSSNLLYVLFLPVILYLTHFLFYNKNINIEEKVNVKSNISEDLLSIPYPESSFRSSNLN